LPDGLSLGKAAEHIYNNGLPARGSDVDLFKHQKSRSESAFRGTTQTPFSQERDAGAGLWASEGELVVELVNRRGYDVNAALEFDSPSFFERVKGNPLRGEIEIAIPAQVVPEGIARVGVRVTAPNGSPRIDWIPRP
jgi:hypothetical protein